MYDQSSSPARPGLVDDAAEALVGLEGVGDQVAGDELVVQLAQGQVVALAAPLPANFLGLDHHLHGGAARDPVDELAFHAQLPILRGHTWITFVTWGWMLSVELAVISTARVMP
jgi:hypothetical protein